MTDRDVYPYVNMVDGFRMWLQVRGHRASSVKSALLTIRQYLRDGEEDDPFVRQSILHYLSNGDVKRVTMRNRYDHLKLFFEYAVSEGILSDTPMTGVPRPRTTMWDRERDAAPITEEMLASLIGACPTWTTAGLRNRAILYTLWDTPLRAGELCAVEMDDLTYEPRELRVSNGKGGVRYSAAFGPRAGLAIQRYHRERDDSIYVFSTRDAEKITVHNLESTLRRISERGEVDPPVYPHQFRHNFRRRCREMGMDNAHVSALMAHSMEATTRTYAREADRQIAMRVLRERFSL